MIDPYPRYRRLYKKLVDCNLDPEMAARTATLQEIRDLTVWSNLVWIDPFLRSRPPFKHLIEKGVKFTEEEKSEMVEAEMALMAETIPIYRTLMEEGRIEEALRIYLNLLKLKPDDAEVLMVAGLISAELDKIDNAGFFYNRVLEIEPWNVKAEEGLKALSSIGHEENGIAVQTPLYVAE